MGNPRISRIEMGPLTGERPHMAGSNARVDEHGITMPVPMVRLTTNDGATGFGLSRASREDLAPLLGARITDAFRPDTGPADAWIPCEYPLWDLMAKREGEPVYALAARLTGSTVPVSVRVPCIDTALYFDDLHLESDEEAAALIASEAREDYERGHRAFKIKVGRGARHQPLEAGTVRDIAVVHAVRDAVGPNATLALDANNGYNANLTKRVLAETAECRITFIEEPFYEDAVLLRDLKAWLERESLQVLIADGEGYSPPGLIDWARDGLLDLVQYDIFSHGFTRWLETGQRLDSWNARSSPHHYGTHYGNYVSCHLAPAIQGFAYPEWDEAQTPGLDTSAYTLEEGEVCVPDVPGFGLALDEERFCHAVSTAGFTLT